MNCVDAVAGERMSHRATSKALGAPFWHMTARDMKLLPQNRMAMLVEGRKEYYIQRPATRAEEDGSTMKDPYLAN